MKVKDILAKKPPGVITISPDQSLLAAGKLLAEHNIGVLIAVDSNALPVGILSERDIIRSLARNGAAALENAVSSAMTKAIITATPDDNLASLSSTMTEQRFRHVPIVEGDALVGIVSIGDIVKAQLSYFEGEARALQTYITGGRA